MMEFIHVAVAVLSLLPLGRSAPVTSCENLIQPREINGNQLLGKWIILAESTSIPGSKMLLQMLRENTWVKISAASEADTFNNLQIEKSMGKCLRVKTNMTLVNNTLTILHTYRVSAVLLNTGCPDCLVIYSNNTIGRTAVGALQLLSRRVKVSAAELEEFTKQAECLNLQPPAIMDLEEGKRVKVSAAELEEFTKQAECLNLESPAILDSEKGFCPDPALGPGTKTIDLTVINKTPDDLNLMENLFTESGMKTILDTVESFVDLFKEG